MPTLTLDTSCIIAAVQQEAGAAAVEQLVDTARAGNVTLSLTAAFRADMSRASSAHLHTNLAWLAHQPILQAIPGPFRLGYSTLGGPDVLVTDAFAELISAIERIVLPEQYRRDQLRLDESAFITKWNRKTNDVQHLAAHLMAGHDAFVTGDHDDIVRKRDRLLALAGIRVYTPGEAAKAINAR